MEVIRVVLKLVVGGLMFQKGYTGSVYDNRDLLVMFGNKVIQRKGSVPHR